MLTLQREETILLRLTPTGIFSLIASAMLCLSVTGADGSSLPGIPVVNEVATFSGEDGTPFQVAGAEFAAPVAVALDAGLAAIGTQRDDSFGADEGAVYLFERQQDGTWVPTAKIAPADGAPCDRFGSGVALRGDVMLVRQDRFASCSAPSSGSGANDVRIFEHSDSGWVQTRNLRYASNDTIAVDGNFAVIGLPDGADVYQRVAPGVWQGPVFLRQQGVAGGFVEPPTSFRGLDVDISEGQIVLGTAATDVAGLDRRTVGRANVFERDASGHWVLTADIITDEEDGIGRPYGSRVSIAGNVLSIGGLIYERVAQSTWAPFPFVDLAPADGASAHHAAIKLDRSGVAVVSSTPASGLRTDVYRRGADGFFRPWARLRLSGDSSLSGDILEIFSQTVLAVSGSQIVGADDDGFIHAFEPAAASPAPRLELVRIDPDITRLPGEAVEITAFADTSGATGRNIREIAVQIGRGPWQTLEPMDGAYDSSVENATGTVTANGRACVRVTDDGGNTTELLDRDTNTCGSVPAARQADPDDRLTPDVSELSLYRTRVLQGQDNTIYAFASDFGRGDSSVGGIQYKLDDGLWQPMKTVPHSGFGTTQFRAAFAILPPARELGKHSVCVSAIDGAGNVAYPPCLSFETVQ
jgi:hypothetical protein